MPPPSPSVVPSAPTPPPTTTLAATALADRPRVGVPGSSTSTAGGVETTSAVPARRLPFDGSRTANLRGSENRLRAFGSPSAESAPSARAAAADRLLSPLFMEANAGLRLRLRGGLSDAAESPAAVSGDSTPPDAARVKPPSSDRATADIMAPAPAPAAAECWH